MPPSCSSRFASARAAAVALGLLVAHLSATPLAAQDAALETEVAPAGLPDRPALTAARRAGSISIDGRIDEAAWAAASPAAGFVQGEPVEGVPAAEETEVRVLFDDDALYVAARMWDSAPERIGAQLVRRDERGAFDWFGVALDPNLDRRTGYFFLVSAAGVQSDRYLYADQREDGAWDAIWSSAVERDSLGWVAELRIPLSQIRYESREDVQTWGVNFVRSRLADDETSYFALRSRLREGVVSQFGYLRQVRVPPPGRRAEVRPYVLGSVHSGPSAPGDPFFDGREAEARAGVDVRWGLGSAFTVDATFNPDFGQVEADPAVINLSAFETFLDERRPFFVEDAQIFDFSLSGRRNSLFYSRRIGREPRGDAPGGAVFSEVPDATGILGAAKLTGRTEGGLSVGALAAVSREEFGRAAWDDRPVDRFLVEPQSRFGVFRLQQDFNGGASQVGGILTAVDRALPADGAFDFLPDRAYTAGVRFDHQWANRTWGLSGFLAGSHVRGDSLAILRIQRSSNHYFQRPDATRLEVDSTSTSMSGAEWRLQLDRQGTGHWTGSVWLAEVTPGFEVNDLGYSGNAEQLDGGFRVGYREIEPGDWYRSYNVTFFTYHNVSHEALEDPGSWRSWRAAHSAGSFNLNGRASFRNFWDGDLNVSLGPDTYSPTATRGGPLMLDPASWSVRGGLTTDRRREVFYRLGMNVRRGTRDSGGSWGVEGQIGFRPSSRLEIDLQPSWSVQRDAAQYVTTRSAVPYAPTFGSRYLFGELDRRTLGLEARASWTFSPSLSLQLFAQPLLSSGDYLSYRQLARPSSYDFVTFEPGVWDELEDRETCGAGRTCTEVGPDGERTQHFDFDGDGEVDASFGDRDFNVRSLVGNAVLRWEYRPGSTVFLVWQRSQSNRERLGDFDLGRDVDALLGLPSEDRLILKVNYWLGI